MKKFFLVFAAASLFTACKNEPKPDTPAAEAPAKEVAETVAAMPEVPLPMTPSYSNSFEFGKSEYSAMIIQGSWKDWDENKLDNMKNWAADTVMAWHSNMTMTRGLDALMARWKTERAKLSQVLDTIDVVLPIYIKDKKEHWVLVWARSISTDLKGKKDTSATMEAWRINKDGKADFLNQYDRAKRKK